MSYISAVEIKKTNKKYYYRWGIKYNGKLLSYFAHLPIKKNGINRAVYIPNGKIDFDFLKDVDRLRFFSRGENAKLPSGYYDFLPDQLTFSAYIPANFVSFFRENPFYGIFKDKKSAMLYKHINTMDYNGTIVLYKVEIVGRLYLVEGECGMIYNGTDAFRFAREVRFK